MYSLGAYGSMIAHRARAEAYAEALRRSVREGSVVVDLGTGPGVFAVLACQLGASRVFAIEPAEVIQLARELATANGCVEKIEFFEDLSSRVKIPVRADVIISDLRGVLPLFHRHIPDIVDARQRFLAPGGSLIPRSDSVYAAIVEAPIPYSEIVAPWDQNPFGQDLSLARRLAVNSIRKMRVSPSQILTGHTLWATLDYTNIESPDVRGKLQWKAERAGTGHGIAMWFDADLAEGASFSNAPGLPEGIYEALLFPWTRPVALSAGQDVFAHVDAKLVEDDYVWRWATRINPVEGSETSPIHFQQSQLDGAVLSPKRFHRSAADHIPQLSCEGLLRRRAFELMDGKATLEEVAHKLAAEFPERFSSWQQALSYAGLISQEFSR